MKTRFTMVNLTTTHPIGTPFPYSAKHLACALLYLLNGEGNDYLDLLPIHLEGSDEDDSSESARIESKEESKNEKKESDDESVKIIEGFSFERKEIQKQSKAGGKKQKAQKSTRVKVTFSQIEK